MRQYLPFSVPAAMVGAYLAPALNISWLVFLFGLFVLGYGVQMLLCCRALKRLPARARVSRDQKPGIFPAATAALLLRHLS